jgi:hypothetical protein
MKTSLKSAPRPARRSRAAGSATLALEDLRAARPRKAKTFGEIYHHAAGCVKSGLGDLSTNKKYLADFGRG